MIKDFETLAAQLKELAPIINSFSSEAVQLRVVELFLEENQANDGTVAIPNEHGQSPPSRKRKRRNTGTPPEPGAAKARSPSGKPSAGATLDKLISDGFFKSARALSDIVTHCSTTLALPYKQSDFSPALVRAVRDRKLSRTKNESGQFQYEQA